MTLCSGFEYDQYRQKVTFIEHLRSLIRQNWRSYREKNKGTSLPELVRQALSLTNLQSEKLSSRMPRPERNCDHYRKDVNNGQSALSLEMHLAALSDSELGPELLSLSEAETGLMRWIMDLTFMASIDCTSNLVDPSRSCTPDVSVSAYFQYWRVHLEKQCQPSQ